MDQKDLSRKLDQTDHSKDIDTRNSVVKRLKSKLAKLQEATDFRCSKLRIYVSIYVGRR
ncbi:hypothetical protein DPMN_159254 [Dreissena polymorpha]|uniref:Uncharacterized protein n=1 Tax=Dreissena polymorpha TaxID=45954 RepID=A0A9D4EP19_DREPO|nr:hypothetical protein DPMN_159254 [Dreissena polymorpha]